MEHPDQPATKADLQALESRFDGKLETLRTNVGALDGKLETLRTNVGELEEKLEILRTETNHHYNDLVERISDGQTEILKAFYSYAQGNNKRIGELEGNEGAFRSRLATIEDRILEVERRLNMPPAA